MDLKTWLHAELGRTTALAKHLGVSVSRVSQIANEGVPKDCMRPVVAFTRGEVTLEDMVPAGRAATLPDDLMKAKA